MLKCPRCRERVHKLSETKEIDVAQLGSKAPKEDDEYDVWFIAGIDVSVGCALYKVVWKQAPDALGVPECSWIGDIDDKGAKVKAFHKRFQIPPIDSFLFKRPTRFEYPVPSKAKSADGAVYFECSACDRTGIKLSNMTQHAAEQHGEGNLGEQEYLKCHSCSAGGTFSNQSNLNRHMRNSHSALPQEDDAGEAE